jgi:hypothetical protein
MSKRLFLGGLVAIVAVSTLLPVWLLRGGDGSTQALPNTVEMGIDPEVAGNDAATLGKLEDCVRVDVEVPRFDNVTDHDIDVYVRGDTLAPNAYTAWVTYDATKIHIVAPRASVTVKLPGAAGFSDALPDTDGEFMAEAIYFGGGGPGIAGDGTLVRLGLDIGGSGVVTFGFNSTAYVSPSDVQDIELVVTRRRAQLAINQECPSEPLTPEPEERLAPPVITLAPTPLRPPQGGPVRYRWGDLSVETPAGADVYVARSSEGISIWRERAEQREEILRIRPDTGEVVSQSDRPDDRQLVDAIVASIRLEADAPTAWPYSGTAPRWPLREENLGLFVVAVFPEPDPASGMLVRAMSGDSPTGDVWCLRIWTARSIRCVDLEGKLVVDSDGQPYGRLDPADAEAFDRFISTIVFETR